MSTALKRMFTAPLSRNCLSCGRFLPITGLLRGSKRAVFDTDTPAFPCPDCGTAQRYRAGSSTKWFFGLMIIVVWIGFGSISNWMETAFPKLLVLDRQDYGLGAAGFMILAIFYFLPAGLLARFVTLHFADLEIVS